MENQGINKNQFESIFYKPGKRKACHTFSIFHVDMDIHVNIVQIVDY